MKGKAYTIYNAPEYDESQIEQPAKSQVQVRSVSHIQEEGHFGDLRRGGDGVWELRWKNGRRVYYADIPERQILLLLGGNKNGQDKDIRQARKIFNKHVSTEEEA